MLDRTIKAFPRPAFVVPWAVLLGLDGSGKSSVLARLQEEMQSSQITGVKVFYRRPSAWTHRTEPGGAGIAHYARPPHGRIKSIAKLGLRALDWWVGYWSRWLPQRARGTLILLDRHYFLDLSIDPLRYRYNGPLWLARLIGRFLPEPDLFILLDAPVEVLHGRKQELSPAEAARQRQAYLDLVQQLPNGYVVDASRPLEQVVNQVKQIILDHTGIR